MSSTINCIGKVGPLVCWDQWYPEAARLTALRRADPVLSHGHRLAARRKGRVRREPALRLGNDDAQPRDRQRRVRRRRQSHRHAKGSSSSGARRSSPIRTATCWPGRRTTRKRRCSWSATSTDRRRAHALAVPARPADRRLRRSDEALHRLDATRPTSSAQSDAHNSTPRRSVTACRPNGSRTPPPGWPGRTSRRPGPASSSRSRPSGPSSCARSPSSSRCTSCAGGEAVMAAGPRSWSGDVPNVTLHDIPTNDAWTRDHGPMFLVGPAGSPPALVDWEYNAWGGKYPPFDLDNAVPRANRRADRPPPLRARHRPGRGRDRRQRPRHVLTTEQCLLNPNRNPQLDRGRDRAVPARLSACATKILWLGGGIAGDDTDGHIDELARFVGPRTVVAARRRRPGRRELRAAAGELRPAASA